MQFGFHLVIEPVAVDALQSTFYTCMPLAADQLDYEFWFLAVDKMVCDLFLLRANENVGAISEWIRFRNDEFIAVSINYTEYAYRLM